MPRLQATRPALFLSMKRENRLVRPVCCLCGYRAAEHILYAVPLSRPPQQRIICVECAEEIRDLLHDRPDADTETADPETDE
jgi:hypothetical protein